MPIGDLHMIQMLARQRTLEAAQQELTEANLRVQHLAGLCCDQQTQLLGGHPGVHPADEPNHPGHVLILLGWEYHPTDGELEVRQGPLPTDFSLGCSWRDPQEKGTGTTSLMPLTMALGIACRRLMGIPDCRGASECKTRAERLVADDG